jgi:hypothetical protein
LPNPQPHVDQPRELGTICSLIRREYRGQPREVFFLGQHLGLEGLHPGYDSESTAERASGVVVANKVKELNGEKRNFFPIVEFPVRRIGLLVSKTELLALIHHFMHLARPFLFFI